MLAFGLAPFCLGTDVLIVHAMELDWLELALFDPHQEVPKPRERVNPGHVFPFFSADGRQGQVENAGHAFRPDP